MAEAAAQPRCASEQATGRQVAANEGLVRFVSFSLHVSTAHRANNGEQNSDRPGAKLPVARGIKSRGERATAFIYPTD